VSSTSDGGSDSSTVDTGVAADTSPDGPLHTVCNDIDAALCEDFDRGPAVPGTPTIANAFGGLSVDSQSSKSPPASLSNQLYPTDAGGFAAAYDRFDVLTGGARRVTVDFAWRVDMLTGGASGGDLDLFILRADGFAGGAAVHLHPLADAGGSLSFGPTDVPLRLPAIGTWEHVHLELAWPSDGGSAVIATAQIGNDMPVTSLVTHPPPQSTFNLLAGGIRVNNGSPVTPKLFHRIDDVIMRTF
jgi:hypothetical protein